MRSVMGVISPDAGRLTWHGQALDRGIRQQFGYMPEERGLYQKMTVGSQVEYFGRLNGLSPQRARNRTQELLELLQLGEVRASTVQSLSLGNQQRVQLAVALVHEPRLLVLDEPFSGLDPIGVATLADVLRKKRTAAGVTILFSSHQLEIVERLVDSVSIIKAGRIVDASPEGCPVPSLQRITVADGVPGWAGRLPGEVVEQHADTVLVDPLGGHPHAVLAQAMSEGRVEHFGWETPSLVRTFQEAMA
jgi:ABC-2 type transport system ATP-binding protein